MPTAAHIVVPCYNEARRLDVDAFTGFCDAHPSVRLLFVDDGSTDDTAAALARLAAHPRIEALSLARNGGKAEAVRRGILAALDAGAGVVGFWDADLATPLAAIPEFLAALDARPEVEIVLGSRVQLLGRDIRRDRRRHYFGRIAATAVSQMLRLPVYDTQCGAKLFRAVPGLRGLFEQPFVTRWVFDVEILARWLLAAPPAERAGIGRRVIELPLQRWVDVDGSKLTSKDFARVPKDLWDIWWVYGRYL